MHKTRDGRGLCRLIVSSAVWLSLSCTLLAQKDRLSAPIDPDRQVVLAGVVNRKAQARYDQGPVDPGQRISGVSLMLKMSADQQADAEKLLEDQRNPSSPDYHNWLTPDQYADRFGLSPADIAKITAWLRDEGLSVDHVARSRNWILFSGAASQLQRVFSVEIHRYQVNGEMHRANANAPSIPAALQTVVQTIMDLDDFYPKPPLHHAKPLASPQPDNTGSSGAHYLVPGDLWVIYDTNPMLAKGINGTGQKIAVIGDSGIALTDMQKFRTTFSLPAADPQVTLTPGAADPGINGDQLEADLDLQWSGAIAPNATILYVYAPSVFTAVDYVVSQNLAPVISLSFGFCELNISGNPDTSSANYRAISQQANMQGITYVASSGDSGSADCDSDSAAIAKSGNLAVNMPASVPEVTAVGGTEFNEGTSAGAYWSSTNASGNASALSYIPEMAWNDSAAGTGLSTGLSSTGGGLSEFFSKPAWQTGPGVPADGVRDVPDISFAASGSHVPYYVFSGGVLYNVGGTSAATPVFAGMLALLNQYLVSTGTLAKPGLGNINPNLYSLAQSTPGIFHDVTVGSNIVPCTPGNNCLTGKMGYTAGPGYDLATGLGSVDFNNLATQWGGKAAIAATTTTVAASPASISVTASTTVTATVKAASGAATPTGSVSFSAGKASLGNANLNGSTASVTVAGNLLTTGANTINATYSGTTSFGSSSGSATVTVTVPTATSAVVPSVTPNPVYQQPADASGNRWFFTAKLSEIAGVATTLTSFSIAGKDFSSSIAALFGSTIIAAHGTISATVGTNVTTVPSNITLSFGGADAGGATWTQQIAVPLYGPQLTGSLALSSAPGTEVLNANGDPSCGASGIYQELNLQESNGHEVTLTKFLAGGNDLTANTSVWFGSWRIAPLGTLQARLCWTVSSSNLPATYDYEIDGVDDQGNTVKTTLSVPFLPPAQNPGTLSASQSGIALAVLPGQSTTASLAVNLPAGQPWTIAKFPSNQTSSWLIVTPQSGTGSGTVSATLSGAALPVGVYRATLVLQSVNTVPQFLNVTVSLTVGTASATSPLSITGVANGASFQQSSAPGMILSVFGANLTNSATALFAPSVPLPVSLGGTTVTVNGVPAPFYYASKTQLNIQVPYETGSGYALLAVVNGGQVFGMYFLVSDAAPGIFVGANSSLVPTSTAKRGDVLTLFMTGEGDVTPPIATGATPTTDTPLSQLPVPRLKPFTITVAGTAVTPLFVGIPYGLVGETQINFPVPANAPLGTQPVVVTVGTVSTVAATINITQ